jgi:hypothetical protein
VENWQNIVRGDPVRRGTGLYPAKAASTEVRNYGAPTKIGHRIGQKQMPIGSIISKYSQSAKNNIGQYAL